MSNNIFHKLESAILLPSRAKEWFGMAEQIINTVYALGERPDVFCNEIIKKLTIRAFTPRKKTEQPVTDKEQAPEAMSEDQEHPGDQTMEAGDVTIQDATQTPDATQAPPDATQTTQNDGEKDLGEAFELSQLLFVVGHIAIKHIVFLELVERELKRQKEEKQTGTFLIFLSYLTVHQLTALQLRRRLMRTNEMPRMLKNLSKLQATLKTKSENVYRPLERLNSYLARNLSWQCMALCLCKYPVVPRSTRYIPLSKLEPI